jgi:hypothetical protein
LCHDDSRQWESCHGPKTKIRSSDDHRPIRGDVSERGSLQEISASASLAGRHSLPALRRYDYFPGRNNAFKWQCYVCAPNRGYRFSVIAGTIFENTNKPLRDWFRVVHLMLASKKGMSALQIQRLTGFGSYETAHSICHKIRAALIAPEAKLGGIVEVDETYIGGKARNRHWDRKPGPGTSDKHAIRPRKGTIG